jgi:hypothetical protein
MATTKTKSTPKLLTAGHNRISWRRLIILASITLNIGFIVIWIGLSATNSLDGLFMEDGLTRYCSENNDDKFKDSKEEVRALRNYVCYHPEAKEFFDKGYNDYLQVKGITRS